MCEFNRFSATDVGIGIPLDRMDRPIKIDPGVVD